jgi:tetratricopeptide (TPR) repeat protein
MKNLSLIVISFLFSGFLSNAQNNDYRERRVDSMISLLKFQKDTSLVLTYRAIFSTYAARDAKKAKPYLDTAITLGYTIENTKLQARLLTDQAYYNYISGNHRQAVDFYKKAIDSYTKIAYQPMLQANYNSLGINQKYTGDLEGAMNSYLESLKISKEIGDTEDFMAPTYLNIGQLHAQLGNIELSNKYYKITEAICEKFDLGRGLAMTRSNMAENMVSELKYEEALPLYLSALPYFEEKNCYRKWESSIIT